MSLVTVAATGERLTEKQWLERRRGLIGASEAAGALGLDHRKGNSPPDVWARKCSNKPRNDSPTLRMRAGKALEPFIAELFETQAGNKLVAQQVYLEHETLPLCATLDAIDDTDTPVEFKSIDRYEAQRLELGPDDTDEVPTGWIVQVHQQMFLHGSTAAHIACLIGCDDFRIFTVYRKEQFIQTMLAGLAKFWEHVQKGTPPDGIFSDPKLLMDAFPPVEDEFEGGEPMRTAWEAYQKYGKAIRAAEKARDALKVDILSTMQGRQCRLPDGTRVIVKESHKQGYTVKPSIQRQLVQLKAGDR